KKENMNNEYQFIEDKIVESLKEAIFAMEVAIINNENFYGHIFEGVYEEAMKYASLPASVFKKTKEPAFFLAEKNGEKKYLTSWDDRKFLTIFFKSIKYTEYNYKKDYFSDYFPEQAQFSVLKLTIWALKKLTTPNQVKKGIIGITNTFSTLRSQSATDYYNLIIKSKDDVLDDEENLFFKSPLSEITSFRIGTTDYYLILSDTDYVFISDNFRAGPTGLIFKSGRIANVDTLKIGEAEFEVTPEGLTTIEMSLYSDTKINRCNVKEEIAKRKPKRKK
ncbi:TPA: hypothetical protein ACIJ25_006565, partial [Pseudomonas aeruginosa]